MNTVKIIQFDDSHLIKSIRTAEVSLNISPSNTTDDGITKRKIEIVYAGHQFNNVTEFSPSFVIEGPSVSRFEHELWTNYLESAVDGKGDYALVDKPSDCLLVIDRHLGNAWFRYIDTKSGESYYIVSEEQSIFPANGYQIHNALAVHYPSSDSSSSTECDVKMDALGISIVADKRYRLPFNKPLGDIKLAALAYGGVDQLIGSDNLEHFIKMHVKISKYDPEWYNTLLYSNWTPQYFKSSDDKLILSFTDDVGLTRLADNVFQDRNEKKLGRLLPATEIKFQRELVKLYRNQDVKTRNVEILKLCVNTIDKLDLLERLIGELTYLK